MIAVVHLFVFTFTKLSTNLEGTFSEEQETKY